MGCIYCTCEAIHIHILQQEEIEGLSHDLVCAGSIYHVHFAWQVWHGQYSPGFTFDRLKSLSRWEIDQNHVDKRIQGERV